MGQTVGQWVSNAFGEASRPTLSVVMPIYNTAEYLDEALRSVEAQSLAEIEIICVDDGSTDGSAEVVFTHQTKDARIRYVHQEHSGAGAARNAGLDLARGTWVAFLDSDDLYLPGFLQKTVGAAERAGADVAICETDAFNVTTGAEFAHSRFPEAVAADAITPGQAGEALFQLGLPAPFNKVFRMSYVLESGLRFQPLENSNDVCFTQSAIAHARAIALVREVLVKHRIGYGTSIQDDLLAAPDLGKCLCTHEALSSLRETCTASDRLGEAGRASLDKLCINASYYSCERAIGNKPLLDAVFASYQRAICDDWRVRTPHPRDDLGLYFKYQLLAHGTASDFAWVYRGMSVKRAGAAHALLAKRAAAILRALLVMAKVALR